MLLSVNVRHGYSSYGSGIRDIGGVLVNYDYDHGNGAQITLTDKAGVTVTVLTFHTPGDMDMFVSDLANVIAESGEGMAI